MPATTRLARAIGDALEDGMTYADIIAFVLVSVGEGELSKTEKIVLVEAVVPTIA